MTGWTHKTEPELIHPVDPRYAANGQPAYWTCHVCRSSVLLDGKAPPLAVSPLRAQPAAEPPMSAQP